MARTTRLAEAALTETYQPQGMNVGREPRPAGRRRHRRSPARAPGAALERRHQLHAGGRQRARAARRPAGRPPSGCGRCSRGSPPSRPTPAPRHDLRSRRADRAPRATAPARRPPALAAAAHELDAVGGRAGRRPAPTARAAVPAPDRPLPWVLAIEEMAAVSGSLAVDAALVPGGDGGRRRGPGWGCAASISTARPRRATSAARDLAVAAVLVGLGRAAIDGALDGTARGQGRAAGRPEQQHWGVADAATELDAARLLLWRAATAAPAAGGWRAGGNGADAGAGRGRIGGGGGAARARRRRRGGRRRRSIGSPATWRRRRWCSAARTAKKRRSPPACCRG